MMGDRDGHEHVSAAGDIQDRNTHIGEVHQSVRA